ncbi:MAG TPA: transketolase [Candidatus Dojkabacteria bacterium]|nr:transketolase [Candidatus Dojkabacteria bacterium]
MDYSKEELDKLRKLSYELKIDVIKMLDKADSGHIGGAFSIADIVTCLYFKVANLDPTNPDWDERDYILLSNGHVCPILYAALARKGFFPKEELNNLRKIDSLLQGHPKLGIPAVENTSGLLGQGLSQGVGMALGLTMDSKPNKVYVITSDGEHQEGQTWEAIMSANKWSLNNLVVIVDRNHVQIDGNTEDIMPLGNLKEKYESFGWIALDINGHDYNEILQIFDFVKNIDQPVAIIAHTIAGEDISFMERLYKYHDWKDDPVEVEKALKELQAELDKFN